jgi:endoglucanase
MTKKPPEQLLRDYSEIYAAAGDETDMRERLTADIEGSVDEFSVNPLGNITAKIGGRTGKKTLLLTAHMDEVAFIVRSIEKNGLLRFYSVGGVVPKILPGTSLHLGVSRIPGVVASKAVHLLEPGERDKIPEVKELLIDVGASSKDEVRELKPGDYIYFRSRFLKQGPHCLGKAFDDRVGCAAVTFLLNRYRTGRPEFDLTAVYTAQEEAGLRGAATAAFGLGPDRILFNLNLEATTCADRELKSTYSPSTELGKGPAITVMDRTVITNRKLLDWVLSRAREHGIPVQLKRTVTGGTDAGRIHLTESGIPSATLALPVRYIHGPWSIMSRKDFDNYCRLAAVLVDEAGSFRLR